MEKLQTSKSKEESVINERRKRCINSLCVNLLGEFVAFRIQLLAQERNDPYEDIDASESSETSLVTNFIRNEEIES